jgi:tetratricopeptide (TPR) repeat protein
MRIVLAVSVSGLLLTRPLHADTVWDRYAFDRDDFAYLSKHDPQAAALLLRGEGELKAGATSAAADTFAAVVARAPDSALAARRECQALTRLHKRPEALSACQKADRLRLTPVGLRALVRAEMSAPPTPQDLVLSTQLAAAAKRQMSDQPWGLAAMADIGERTGDENMLATSVTELERIAPGNYETRRARAALDTFRLSRWASAAWVGLALVSIGTVCHAAWVRLAPRRSSRRLALPLAAALLVGAAQLFSAASASAQSEVPAAEPPPGGLSKWRVNDADPVKSLPTTQQRDRNPLEYGYHLMDLTDKADIAQKKGDWLSVAKYYEAIAVAVPDHAIGFRRSCDAYEKVGNATKALEMCRGALAGDGVELRDYTHFAKLMFERTDAFTPADEQDISDIIQHLKEQSNSLPAALDIECQLAQRLDDVKRLETCVADVTKLTPDEPKLVVYQWAIAMKHEDYRKAQQLIDVARQRGLKPDGIDMMARMTQQQSALGGRVVRAVERHPAVLGAVLGLLAVLGLSVALRRRLKLRPA